MQGLAPCIHNHKGKRYSQEPESGGYGYRGLTVKESTMKITHRIPTTQYGYMEVELESDTVEDGVIEHIRLQRLYTGETGLDVRAWKKVREHMLATGECDPEDIEMMNNAQRWWVNEVKLGMRALKAEDPVIN